MRVLMLKNHTSPDGTRHQKGSVWIFSDDDGATLVADGIAELNEPTAEEIAAADPQVSTESAVVEVGADHEEG